MRALSVELEDELVDVLEAERELFGFESRQAYVRWIIDHRGSITAEPEPTTTALEAAHERLATLEQRLAAVTDREATPAPTHARSAGDDCSIVGDDSTDSTGSTGESPPTAVDSHHTDDGWTRPKSDPSVEVRGSPRTTVSRESPAITSTDSPDGRERDRADSSVTDAMRASDQDRSPACGRRSESEHDATPETNTQPLSPERVVRIPGDPISEDADVLETVEFDRLDELSRRAIATTRKRLNREVQTGLEYTSSTRLASDGIRPGEELADLEALSLPGRSSETLEQRRRAVGRALAYVRDEGRARRSDFIKALYTECPAEYETADGWWRCIKAGLKQVDCVDGGEGTRVWRYRR